MAGKGRGDSKIGPTSFDNFFSFSPNALRGKMVATDAAAKEAGIEKYRSSLHGKCRKIHFLPFYFHLGKCSRCFSTIFEKMCFKIKFEFSRVI